MGINTPSDVAADLMIAPTDSGHVRLFVTTGSLEVPMDFTVEEAREIAEEILAAAEMAESATGNGNGHRK